MRRSDGHKLFYAGQVNLAFGDHESGKTWICLAAATEALKDGRRVLVIDLDHNGAEATVHRLLALGAPEDRLRDPAIFRYCEPEDRTELRGWSRTQKSGGQRLRSLTALANCSRCAARTPYNSDEFTTVHTNVLKPLAKAGAAVLAVNHLAKFTRPRPGRHSCETLRNRRGVGSR